MSVKILGARVRSQTSTALQIWEIEYEVAGVRMGVTVHARSESEARAKATENLERQRLPNIPDGSWLDEHSKRMEATLPRNWRDD